MIFSTCCIFLLSNPDAIRVKICFSVLVKWKGSTMSGHGSLNDMGFIIPIGFSLCGMWSWLTYSSASGQRHEQRSRLGQSLHRDIGHLGFRVIVLMYDIIHSFRDMSTK